MVFFSVAGAGVTVWRGLRGSVGVHAVDESYEGRVDAVAEDALQVFARSGDSAAADREEEALLASPSHGVRVNGTAPQLHREPVGVAELPTFAELDAAIDQVGGTFKFASLLIACSRPYELEPVIQGDWKAALQAAAVSVSLPCSALANARFA